MKPIIAFFITIFLFVGLQTIRGKKEVIVKEPVKLSEWQQLKQNLASSVMAVHGDLRMYDNYCKVLHCESNGWQNAKNPKSTATGLFQCMHSTFKHMKKEYNYKITFAQFAKLPLKEQALYFDDYLMLYDKKIALINTHADQKTRQAYAYLMVLKPSAVGRGWNGPVFVKGKSDYGPNKCIPHVGDTIKVKDVYNFCMRKFFN